MRVAEDKAVVGAPRPSCNNVCKHAFKKNPIISCAVHVFFQDCKAMIIHNDNIDKKCLLFMGLPSFNKNMFFFCKGLLKLFTKLYEEKMLLEETM